MNTVFKQPEGKFFHWPDHVIGKRESRRIREDHNAALNELIKQRDQLLDNLRAACNVIDLLLPLVAPSNDRWSETGLTDKGRAEVQAHLSDFKAAIALAERGEQE